VYVFLCSYSIVVTHVQICATTTLYIQILYIKIIYKSLTIESESGILDRDNFYKEILLIKYLSSSFEFGIIY